MKKSRAIVKEQFSKIMEAPNDLWYGAHKHAKATPVCPHMAQEMRYPRGAGDASYAEAATAFRMTGNDPGFAIETPMNVPQDLITANRQAFVEGLKMAAPDDVMAAYLTQKLAEEDFVPRIDRASERLYNQITQDFPRMLEEPAQNVCPRRASLEHDIRKTFNEPQVDDLFQPRHDRKNLSHDDLMRTYQVFRDHPELFLALKLWQDSVKDYFANMDGLIAWHVEKEYGISNRDFGSDASEITEKFPLYHTVNFSLNSVDLPQQIIFYGAAMTAQAALQEHDTPDDADMLEGASKMQPAGFFRRAYESEWGARKIMCPFGATAVRWLMLDLGDEGAPQDSAIAQCAAKIREALPENEHLQNMARAVQKAMDVVMSESSPQITVRATCPHAR